MKYEEYCDRLLFYQDMAKRRQKKWVKNSKMQQRFPEVTLMKKLFETFQWLILGGDSDFDKVTL